MSFTYKQKGCVMKKLLFISLVAGLFTTQGLLAEDLYKKDLYKKCIACHGAQGEKVALGKSKIIKDMSKEDFIASMKGYQDGTYGGPMKTVMLGQVKNLSDADIQKLADYIVK